MRRMFPGVFLTAVISASLVVLQMASITVPTGEAELIETPALTFLTMTEGEYQKLAKQMAQSPTFVPIKKKPDGLSPGARFGLNLILGGRNLSWIIDGNVTDGYIFYADFNANGDLGDDPVYKFELEEGKPSLRLKMLAREQDGGETYPVIMKLVIDWIAPAETAEKKMALLIANRTKRRGQIVFESGGTPLSFILTGSSGIYNGDYEQIAFDLDNDGEFDPKVESYLLFEKYVNIGEITYEFEVNRYGRSITLKPLVEKRPARAILEPGYPAPDFAFVDIEGNRRRLSDYRGKVVLLDFWGTWCGPCVSAVPRLVALYEKYDARGFEILGIATNDTPEKLKAFTAEKQMRWPQTTEGDKGPIATLYRIRGWPSYFLIGAEGNIIVASPGGGDIDIEAALAKLFGEKEPF